MVSRAMTRREFLRGAMLGVAGLTVSGALFAEETPPRRNALIYFTKFLHGLTPGEIAAVVKGIGLEGLDLAVRRGQAVNPGNVREALPGAMKLWRESGLSVRMVSTETSLTDPHDPTVEPLWAACAEAGVRNIKIGYWRWRESESYWKMVDQARRNLETFSRLSENHHVRTLVHNHSGPYLACNASTLMTLLKDLDPAHVGAYVDPAHLAINGEPLPLALEIVGNHLAMIAVKNVAYAATRSASGTKWSKRWCLLRDGLVDWPAAIELLRTRGYDGPLSLHGEYSGPEQRDAILKNVAEDAEYLISIVA